MPEELNIKFIFIFCVRSYFTGMSWNNIHCLIQTIISSWHEFFFVCYRIFRLGTLLFSKIVRCNILLQSRPTIFLFPLALENDLPDIQFNSVWRSTFIIFITHGDVPTRKNFRRFPRKKYSRLKVFFSSSLSLRINKRTWRKGKKAAKNLMTRIYYYVYGDNFHKNVYRRKEWSNGAVDIILQLWRRQTNHSNHRN